MASQIHNPGAILEAATKAFGTGGDAVAAAQAAASSQPQPPAAPPTAPEGIPAAPPVHVPTPEEMAAAAQAQVAGEPAPAPQRSPLLQKLLDRVGGSEDQLLEMLANQVTATAGVHRDVAQLRELIQQQRQAPPPNFNDDPAVKFHADQLTKIDADVTANIDQMSKLAGQADDINKKVLRLTGQLDKAEDHEKPSIQSEISQLRNEYTTAYNQYLALNSENKRLYRDRDASTFSHQQALQGAKQAFEAQQRADAEDAEADSVAAAEVNQAFDAALVAHAARYGVRVTPKLRSDFANLFQAHVASSPKDAPGVDFNVWVGQSMDAMAQNFGLSPKADFTHASRQRAAAAVSLLQQPQAPLAAPTPGPQSGATIPQGFEQLPASEQAKLVRAHARRVLMQGGIANPSR